MFELAIVKKFIKPSWKQLSVSIISLISSLVISLVVWLIIVFFSATDGLEKGWTDKLTRLTAPIRITPTSAYYNSYYYSIDAYSAASDYALKSLREKQQAHISDPYNPDIDAALPTDFASPLQDNEGKSIDLVKELIACVQTAAAENKLFAHIEPYEIAVANLKLHLSPSIEEFIYEGSGQILSQASYLVSFDSDNTTITPLLLPFTPLDIQSAIKTIDRLPITASSSEKSDFLHELTRLTKIQRVSTKAQYTTVPLQALPNKIAFTAVILSKAHLSRCILLPESQRQIPSLTYFFSQQGWDIRVGQIQRQNTEIHIQETNNLEYVPLDNLTLLLAPDSELELISIDLRSPTSVLSDTPVTAQALIQGKPIQWTAPLEQFHIAAVSPVSQGPYINSKKKQSSSFVLTKTSSNLLLPYDDILGYGILVPKSFRDNGVRWLDRGSLSFYGVNATSMQEQHQNVFVAGFYDPGIIPIGGRLVLADPHLVSTILAQHTAEESSSSTGFNIRFTPISQVDTFKSQIEQDLRKRGIDSFWKVQTYKEFEFTKDLYQQLRSEKNLFSLISIIIIVVACSNIVSMLIILVHDKRRDIAILRALGASKTNIALIFGLCGLILASLGSIVGACLAWLTVDNLPTLLNWLSWLQGFDVLNTQFYGDFIPQEVSLRALYFVFISTLIAAVVAGLIPALKASKLNPSQLLKSE